MKTISEEERLEFILILMQKRLQLAHELALKSLREKSSFYALLDQGLELGDASTIEWWLKATVPRIGFTSSAFYLRKMLDKNPKAVIKALYFIPSFLPEDNPRATAALEELNLQARVYEDLMPKDNRVPHPTIPGKV
jgi:hypothetical protein